MKNFDNINLPKYFEIFCCITVRVVTDTLGYVMVGVQKILSKQNTCFMKY